MEYEQLSKRYVCRFCKGSFDQPENLYKHVQQIHTVRTSTRENRTCLLCGVQCQKSEDYRNHLRHIHCLNEEGQVFSFKCFNDFILWKNETEKRNYCKFVMRTVPKVLPSNDKVHMYQCDSSGSKSKDKKGFVAVKDTCPAMISAVESAKTRGIKVEYWNNHIGHPVPVEDDELDAAINSLQVPEIVLGDDQRFQSDSASNIFLLTESNEGSLSDSVVNETPKGKKSLFMKSSHQSTSDQSKHEMQKFSFRKDPSKKMPSFQFSLASVACMKPKPKPKKPDESIVSVTTTFETNSDSSTIFTAPTTIEPLSEQEECMTSNEKPPEDNATTIIKLTSPNKSQEKEPAPIVLSTTAPSTKSSSSATQSNVSNLSFISDGVASGQYIILNSVPGENGVQNLLLCPVGAKASSGNTSISSGANSSKQSEENAVIIISPTGEILAEKENTSSVQNVLTFKPNTPLPVGAGKSFLPSGKSLLKKQRAKKQSKKLKGSSLEKSITSSPNKLHLQQSSLLKDFKSISTLAASNKPASASFTPILVSSAGSIISNPIFVSSASATQCKPVIVSSAGLGKSTFGSSALNKRTIISSATRNKSSFDTSGDVQNVITFNMSPDGGPSTQLVNNALCSPLVGQTLLQPGQTFMSFNNNLIPIGNSTTSFLSSNLNSSFMIPTSSSVMKNSHSSLTSVPVTSQQPTALGSSAAPNVDQVNQLISSLGKALPPNAVPIIIVPSNENLTSISSASLGTSIINTVLSNASKTTMANSAASNPLIVSSIQSLVSPQILSSNQYLSSIFPGGAQPIPSPVRPGNSKFLSALLADTPHGRSPPVPKTSLISPVPKTSVIPPKTKTSVIPPKTKTSVIPPKSKTALISPKPKISSISSIPKSIVSTTVSNTVQVQRVTLPIVSSAANRSNISFNSTPIISQTNTLNPIVLNTEPISSTPAINIPSTPKAGEKSGTLYFKSPSGGIYMLEPVDDALVEKSNLIPSISGSNCETPTNEKLIPTAQDKVNLPDTNIGSLNKTSIQEVNGKSFMTEQDQLNIPVMNTDADENENVQDFTAKVIDPVQSHLEIKVDRKLKTPSPRKTPEFRNGVQIKSVVQEKRPFKEDDVEILKKVKYYQMEMKYLSSQAECKRLKLELAKAKMKNEALMNKEDNANTNVESSKVDVICEKLNKLTKCDKLDSTPSVDINVDEEGEIAKDAEDKQSIVRSVVEDIVAKVTRNIDVEDEESMDIEVMQDIGDETCHSTDDEIMQGTSDETCQSNNDEIMQVVDDEMDPAEEIAVDQGFESEMESVVDTDGKHALHIPELNKSLEITELAQQVVDANNPDKEETLENMLDEEPVIDLHPGEEEGMSAESLKSLEDQYGKQSPLDIYTMIRTSVLRSLYEDMKGLCEENKKLFEELQNYRAHDQLFEILDEELHEEL